MAPAAENGPRRRPRFSALRPGASSSGQLGSGSGSLYSCMARRVDAPHPDGGDRPNSVATVRSFWRIIDWHRQLTTTPGLKRGAEEPWRRPVAQPTPTFASRQAQLHFCFCARGGGRRRRAGRPDAEIQEMAVLAARALPTAAAEDLLAADYGDVEEALQGVVGEERVSLVLRT